MTLDPSRIPRAEKALAHAAAGVTRARGRCLKAWTAWLDATDDRRWALEIEVEAARELRLAIEEERQAAAPKTVTQVNDDANDCPDCGPGCAVCPRHADEFASAYAALDAARPQRKDTPP